MPRSNLPRPAHARRPTDRGESAEAPPPSSNAGASSDVPQALSAQPTELAANSDAASSRRSKPEQPTEPAARSSTAPSARQAVTAVDLSNRATAKVGLDSRAELKRATLVRADSEGGGDTALATTSYVGCIIDGRYRIDAMIGRGGMGVVYRGRHEVIDKLVAIKILLPTEDLDVVARFVNEARAATSIGNPHIVDTIDFGQLPDESTYFAMEYLEGQTLAGIIKEAGYLPVHRAIHVSKQIAEGMSAAHAANIVHRDLKPENVFVTQRGKETDFVKLLDFGIAKVATAQNRITRAGTIFGTPHYMSPEQAAGTEVDHRSDVYSLGVMLYEMVGGRTPFESENTMGLLTQHMYTMPKPLTDRTDLPQSVPVQLDAIVLKCLSKRPEDRYSSMRDVIEDLERLEQGKNPAAFADLLGRRDQELASVRAAARAASRGSLTRLWIVGAVSLAVGVSGAVVARQARQRSLPTAIDSRGEPLASSSATPDDGVSLVFSPIDAEVFRGNQSLGGMPVTIHVEPGSPVRVVIKRDGFYPEPVVIDGSSRVVIVRLQEIPGATPSVPVPDDSPLQRFAEEHELDMSKMLLGPADAGSSPARRDAGGVRTRTPDAGAEHTKTRAAAPPALRPASPGSVGSSSSPSGAGESPKPPLEAPSARPSE